MQGVLKPGPCKCKHEQNRTHGANDTITGRAHIIAWRGELKYGPGELIWTKTLHMTQMTQLQGVLKFGPGE
eukprot:scaffold32792_cov18-Tisochrysis_lutea.AAC.1